MATRILVNSILLGTSQLWPGSTFDTVKDAADIAAIQAAGGLLWDGADATVADAAALARAVRARAGDLAAAESLMQSAVQDSQRSSISSSSSSISAIQSATRVEHETFIAPDAPATSLGTIAESAASASPTLQPGHPRVLQVVFAAGWEGGDVTVSGVSPAGIVVTQTFTSPGIGGGTVAGTKIFALINSPDGIVNSAPAGAADLADVQVADGIGVANAPFSSLVKLSVDGADEAAALVSLTNGYFVPTTPADGTKNFEVWYTRAAV